MATPTPERLSTRITRVLLDAPRHAARLLLRGDARLTTLADTTRRTEQSLSDLQERTRQLEKQVTRVQAKQLDAIAHTLDDLQRELGERLLQYNLQLGRIAAGSARPAAAAVSLGGAALPTSVDQATADTAPGWETIGGGVRHPDPEEREWLALSACPFCGHDERTLVLEWNKLIMLERAPDAGSARYDYSMCHACGVLYAARRPVGARFTFLLEHFGEVTAKHGDEAGFTNPLLNPYPLTADDQAKLRRMASRGVFVSEHLGLKKSDYLEGLVKDRFENSVHVDLLGMLLSPTGARVLELRPRTGMIAESLRRLYGCDVSVVPMWESQQLLLDAVYGFESSGLVDYDHFTVPFPGRFDLIVCNHMLTHMLRPMEFLRELRTRLSPGGHVYFYNEPEDREYLDAGQSMIAHFNPLHMQAFDRRALVRVLAANGFEVVFIKGRNQNHLCLARVAEAPSWAPMPETERESRLAALRRARDRAILKVPAKARPRLASEWQSVVARALTAGDVEFDDKGRLRFVAAQNRGK